MISTVRVSLRNKIALQIAIIVQMPQRAECNSCFVTRKSLCMFTDPCSKNNSESKSTRRVNVWRITSTARSGTIADGPRDALCQSKSCQLLHNCMNKLYNKSTTNQIDVGERIISYMRPATTRQLSWLYSTSSIVNEFCWQHDRLEPKTSKSSVWNKALEGSIPLFLKKPEFICNTA